MDRVINEKVCRRARIERELANTVDQRVLRCFVHRERMDEYHMLKRRRWRSNWRVGMGNTEVRLDG